MWPPCLPVSARQSGPLLTGMPCWCAREAQRVYDLLDAAVRQLSEDDLELVFAALPTIPGTRDAAEVPNSCSGMRPVWDGVVLVDAVDQCVEVGGLVGVEALGLGESGLGGAGLTTV